ncbi:MAG: transcription-repair coupling factor [Coriobacteriia bacterium]|nr:transcription-repair coupling factor [Coriobacteriia bacterium]
MVGKLGAKDDISVAAPISSRPFFIAATYTHAPRSMLVLASGEAAADHISRELRLWLGNELVLRLPLYTHQPWRDQAISEEHVAQAGQRARAISALQNGDAVIVVASVESILRKTAPSDPAHKPIYIKQASNENSEPESPTNATSLKADSIANPSYDSLKAMLVDYGYERFDQADAQGRFALRGDILDVWPAGAVYPSRVEFFGDDVEQIKRLVPITYQSIGALDNLTIYPAKAVSLTKAVSERAIRRLFGLPAEELTKLPLSYSDHIEAIREQRYFPELELYLDYLYERPTGILGCLSEKTLVIALEPRSLFDAAARYYDSERESIYRNAVVDERAEAVLASLFEKPAQLDFGRQQLLTVLALISSSSGLDLRLDVKHPTISGSEERLAAAARSFVGNDYFTVVGTPSVQARKDIELALLDEHVSFSDLHALDRHQSGPIAYVSDFDIPIAMTFPAAKLALLGLNDNSASSVARRVRASRGTNKRSSFDPTELTFPFQPGDYVVHEVHGIALFKAIVRQEVAGIERDYLQLEYAQGDKLFSPVEQIDRITRYVGPNSSAPKLTRLNTSDWSRATGKARKAARQLAFDLVDLYARRASVQGFAYAKDTDLQAQMEAAFEYDETPDQLAAIADVKADMESPRPMDRLICGDVGFGKTEVALRAAFKAIMAGKQVLFLAPTTILVQQHYTTFFERFNPFAVSVDMLSRFRTAAEQRDILKRLADGQLDLIIGTHRLLSADVNPKNLGLIIIDEEQRFGVQHKEQLKNMREQVDVLTLSATPIPRTLQMALSGVRDMSLINTPPVSRTPVKVQVGEWNEDIVSSAIRHEIGRGGQVYYVSNRVQTIQDAEARVFAAAPEADVGIAHGQLSPRQLEDVMERFAGGEFNVLVATTIIESGLDNPHTNTLIIEDSQRLGLAQLYQLKGRVGRSHTQAYAYFLYPSENQLTVEAIERLMAIDELQDLGSGMRIAMKDLEIRGAGTLLGAEQSGYIAAVGFDFFASMINEAVRAARAGELAEGFDDLDSKPATKPKQEVRIDIPEPCFFPEEYMAAADERVVFYRRLAAADDLDTLDLLESRLLDEYGALPAAAINLIDRERCRVTASSLGISSIYLQRQALVFEAVHLNVEKTAEAKKQGALYFAKSYKLQWPLPKGDAQAEGAKTPRLYQVLSSRLDILSGLIDEETDEDEF